MASASFSIEGTTVPAAVAVAYGATVDFVLLSTTGVKSIAWAIAGSSKSTLTNPTITPAGNPSGATASCTHVADPGDGSGAAFLVRCSVTDDAGVVTTQYGVFGTASNAGIIPATAGEQLARSATHGWLEVINTPATIPAPVSLTTGIGITLAAVSDPAALTGTAVRMRAKETDLGDTTETHLIVESSDNGDGRVLTSPRLIEGDIQVKEYSTEGQTTDDSTWTTIHTLTGAAPAEGLSVVGIGRCACGNETTKWAIFALRITTIESAVGSTLEVIAGDLVLDTDIRSQVSGSNILIQVKGTLNTIRWQCRVTLDEMV